MTRNDLLGSWRLTAVTMTDKDGTVTEPFGKDVRGILIYAPAGEMSATVNQAGSYLSYAGSFDVEGDRVIHHVEMSSLTEAAGTDQQRIATLEGDTLTLAASPTFMGPPGSVARLVWQRAV